MLKIGTLFSGIGAPEESLKCLKIDYDNVFACEIDSNARKTYNYNHKVKNMFQDINDMLKVNVPYADVMIFGPPCQSFSIAGKRESLKDERGMLFLKSLDIVKKVQPKYFIAENVKGLYENKKVMNLLLKKMKDIGYEVRYKLLNAIDFGLAQRRERVWFVGIRKDIQRDFCFKDKEYKSHNLKKVLCKKVDKRYYATISFLEKEKFKSSLQRYSGDYIPCVTHTIARNGSSREYISYIASVYKACGQYRKPTPQECLKLFGFRKGFKFHPDVSVTQQYYQIANSMPVNVLAYILRGLIGEEHYV